MNPETLDIENFPVLLSYLRRTGHIAPAESPRLTTLAGGVSNRTVLVKRDSGQAWVLKQALPKLRVQVEWFSDPRRIEREALGMKRLVDLAPPGTITRLVFLDPVPNLLAMEAVPQPHENWKTMLMSGRLDLSHVAQFATLLGTIHRRAWEQRAVLWQEFDDRSFFESLRLEPYYLYTATHVPQAADFLHDLIIQTRATRYTLVHGDFSPKNILIHAGKLILLDHEVIHFGDGAFDLGFALAHLLSKAHHLRELRPAFTNAARHFWSTYRAAIGDVPWAADVEPRAVAHTLGCLLARCRGRSPLEYLDESERGRQTETVVELMREVPRTLDGLVDEFIAGLGS